MTDAAFALADLPAPEADELWPTMVSAVDAVIALVRPPPHPGVLIYLDCPPAVAAQRLRGADRDTGASPEQVSFLTRMHAAYEFLLRERDDVVRIDANEGISETVAAAVPRALCPAVTPSSSWWSPRTTTPTRSARLPAP